MQHYRNNIYFYENGTVINTSKSSRILKPSSKGFLFFQIGNMIYFFNGKEAYQTLENGNYPEPVLTFCVTNEEFRKSLNIRTGLLQKSIDQKIFTHCKRLCSEVF